MKKVISLFLTIAISCGLAYSQQTLEAAFRATQYEIAAGDCVDFFDESSGHPTSWQWSFPGSQTEYSEFQNPDHICYLVPGVYDVILEVQNSNAVDTERVIGCITVNENTEFPIANFSANHTTIPVGGVVQFSNLSQNGPFIAYEWTFNGGDPYTSGAETPVPITYTNVGSYSVELRVKDEDENQDIELRNNYITVIPAASQPPVADFVADRVYIAPGDVINFSDMSRNYPYIWEWTFEGALPATSNKKNPNGIIYTMPGTYDVTLIVHNNLGRDTIVKEDYIVVSATDPCFSNPGVIPRADFTASQRLIRSGTKVYFQDRSENTPTIWSWRFDGGLPTTSSISNLTKGVEYNRTGSFDVFLAVNNACGGSDYMLKEDYILVFSGPVTEYCDTIKNIGPDENIMSPGVNGTWGKIGGHNGLKDIAYAEKYNQHTFTEITELVMAVSRSKARSASSYVTFYVWDGNSQYPGEILGEKRVLVKDLPENFYASVVFDEPVEVDGPFFVGYGLNYYGGSNTSANSDEFAISMANHRGSSGANTFYVQENDSTWKTLPQKYNINTSSTLTPRSCILESETFDVDNNIEIFPNPASEKVFIRTGDLAYGKNILIQLVDITGKILTTEKVKVAGQDIEINVNHYPEGLYFVNMIVDQHRVTKKIMVTK